MVRERSLRAAFWENDASGAVELSRGAAGAVEASGAAELSRRPAAEEDIFREKCPRRNTPNVTAHADVFSRINSATASGRSLSGNRKYSRFSGDVV